jgi:hypothetical protein
MNDSTISIPKNRKKQILFFLLSLLFVFGSVYVLKLDSSFLQLSLIYKKVIAVTGGVFFSMSAIVILLNILKTGPGLIVDENGITNNSNILSGYFVNWEDVKSMRIFMIRTRGSGQRYIGIKVKNNEKIYAQINLFKRTLLKLNARFQESPVYITESALNQSLEETLRILEEKHELFKTSKTK